MADEEHLKVLRQGAEAWNAWRRDNPNVRPDLSGAFLIGAHFFEANPSEANLAMASLMG